MVAAREVAGAWEAPPLRREATWRSMRVSIQPLGGGIRRYRLDLAPAAGGGASVARGVLAAAESTRRREAAS